jgi:hypothetical protein
MAKPLLSVCLLNGIAQYKSNFQTFLSTNEATKGPGPFNRHIFIAIFLFELSITTVWSVYIFDIVSSNLYLSFITVYKNVQLLA